MKTLIAIWIPVMLLAGCAATNALVHMKPDYTELPAAELRTLATAIETIVASGEESFTLDATPGIQVDTPAIQQAIRTRAIRYPLVSEFLDSGFANEQSNGLMAVRRSGGYKKATTSQQRDREALIVMSENNNRWAIYEGLLEANNWPPRSLSAIQAIFFEARVPLMKAGQSHDALPGS